MAHWRRFGNSWEKICWLIGRDMMDTKRHDGSQDSQEKIWGLLRGDIMAQRRSCGGSFNVEDTTARLKRLGGSQSWAPASI